MTDAEFIQLIANDDLDSSLHMYKQRGIRLQAIAQRLEADEWKAAEIAPNRKALLVFRNGIVWTLQPYAKNNTLFTHWKPLPKGPQ